MKNITTSVLGFEIPVTDVPETLEEGIAAFGGEQNLLDACLNYVRFHKTNTEARAEVAERIEKVTGVERTTKKVKAPTKTNPDNTREEFDESEADYVKRAIAESGRTVSDLSTEVLADLSLKFNAVGTPRVGGPKKLAAIYLKLAQGFMDDQAKLDKAMNALAGFNIPVATDENGKPTLEGLAAAIKANKERIEAEVQAKAAASLEG